MKFQLTFPLFLVASVCHAVEFGEPVRIMSGEAPLKVEQPGYAAPCFADINADGKKELLVGQFNQGKIKVYQHLDKNKFGEGKWLMDGQEIISVPGVW